MAEDIAPDDDAEDTGDKSKPSEADDKILKEARDFAKQCDDADGTNRSDAKDDLLFLSGGVNQWKPEAVAQREQDGRPIITVNDLPTFLHQVTNDQRQNTPSIKVHPVDSNADLDTAEVYQGLIRHIEASSNADVAYDTAVNSGAGIGFGYWQITVAYCREDSFDQEIRFRRIRNALSVRFDPLSVEADGGDAQRCLIEYPMSRKDFKRDYPKASACDDSLIGNGAYTGWLSDQTVLVCEFYKIEKEDVDIVELSDGTTGFKDKLLDLNGTKIVRTRKGTRSKCMWRKITATDVLETTEIKFRKHPRIPVYPVYGDEIDVEGKVIRSGIIRHAKGPCQMYNVMMSGATEEIALRTKSPYIGAEGFMEGHENDWALSNKISLPALEYKLTDLNGKIAPPPQRQPMADIPTGMLAMAMHAQDNKKKTMGLFDASLGARGTATSGRQEIAQQREGDMANYHYSDGLIRSIGRCGRDMLNMIPEYYDAERSVRILGEDGTAQHVTINQPNLEQKKSKDGKIRTILNDMGAGEYDLVVSAGPSYSTLRQEAAEAMADNMAKNPALWPLIGDLYVRAQDWPGAGKMADRLEKALAPGMKEPKEGEEPQPMVPTPQGPVPVEQAAQMIGDLMMQLEQASEAVEKAQVAKQEAEALKQQNAQGSLSLDAERVEIERMNAETALLKAQTDAAKAEDSAMAKETELLLAHQQLRVDAATAEAMALNGDTTAFEVWKSTLEADTKIQVAEIMARSSERKAAMSRKNTPKEGARP